MVNKSNTKIYYIFNTLRVHQWSKNILIFLPIFLSQQINLENIKLNFFAFITFSLTASLIYIINDIIDVEHDRKHPTKKNRPLAAKKIKISHCATTCFFLVILIFFFLPFLSLKFKYLLFAYFIVANLYSFYFKKLIIIDLIILSSLYTLRILAGGIISNIYISFWLISFSLFFFFSLATIKRIIEFNRQKKFKKEKINGRGYIINDNEILNVIAISTGYISIFILILYNNSNEVINLFSKPQFLWGINFIFLYWISRIFILTNRNFINDDPVIFALKDPISYICLLLILLINFISI